VYELLLHFSQQQQATNLCRVGIIISKKLRLGIDHSGDGSVYEEALQLINLHTPYVV
jgi:hypothetical protein